MHVISSQHVKDGFRQWERVIPYSFHSFVATTTWWKRRQVDQQRKKWNFSPNKTFTTRIQHHKTWNIEFEITCRRTRRHSSLLAKQSGAATTENSTICRIKENEFHHFVRNMSENYWKWIARWTDHGRITVHSRKCIRCWRPTINNWCRTHWTIIGSRCVRQTNRISSFSVENGQRKYQIASNEIKSLTSQWQN